MNVVIFLLTLAEQLVAVLVVIFFRDAVRQ